ncbi:hypothetical protein O181_024685 [Austropuccinia psidii MF-1]|uniref:Reverse transcriptase domain-containing protein n=1 Tax=Austropuccinia psidii MF-1 TaxID=1389203 RepID=A0A9Q3CL05_9BASI|nr:hypothetical protein [Austropuccinia psidii MF-1]
MGIYEYTRIPFEIKNAAEHFKRMMDTIFKEERLEGRMVVYIDGISIYSETWEDHVKCIDRVLRKFTPINMKSSLKNCNFGKQELLALGNIVSVLILAIDQKKSSSSPAKTSTKGHQKDAMFPMVFLLLQKLNQTNCRITSSLYKVCSKDVVFEITKERRDSYDRIKHELTNAPFLILPDFELSFK